MPVAERAIPDDSPLRETVPAVNAVVACRNESGSKRCVLPDGHVGVHMTAKRWNPSPRDYTVYWVRGD